MAFSMHGDRPQTNGNSKSLSAPDRMAEAGDPKQWDIVDANYWQQMADLRRKEDDAMAQEHEATTEALKLDLVNLYGERTRLAKALLDVRLAVEKNEKLINTYTDKFNKKKAQMAKDRQQADEKARKWFVELRHNRKPGQAGEDADAMDEDESKPTVNGTTSKGVGSSKGHAKQSELVSRRKLAAAGTPSTSGAQNMGVDIFDPNHNRLHQLRQINLSNSLIEDILRRPVKRHVSTRAGDLEVKSNLASIYDSSDNKGSRWISCMIQAVGEVQDQPCDFCRQKVGPFATCVRVGGDNFPKCGNCEWNYRSCQGASPPSSDQQATLGQDYDRRFDIVLPPPSAAATEMPFETAHQPVPLSSTPATGAKKRRSLPGAKAGKRASKPSSPAATPDGSEQSPDRSDGTEGVPKTPVDEITKDKLALVHDGMVYLEPEIMRGVPVNKITPDHAYWDPKWRNIEDLIRPKLDDWTGRFNGYKSRNVVDDKHARYLAGRQVNRGTTSINFLRNGPIHPYQIVAKDFVTAGITNYDTLHRMIATLEELAKFNIDVTPLEWLRQRLHERYTEDTTAFRLDRVLHNMYHDPKLKDLRSRNGFGHIGRPPVRGDDGARKRGPPSEGKKRKEPPTSARSTPKKRSPEEARTPPVVASQTGEAPPATSSRTTASSRTAASSRSATSSRAAAKEKQPQQRSIPGVSKTETLKYAKDGLPLDPDAGDLDFDGYTTADSFSMDIVTPSDWRIHQIKTSSKTSNPNITQYWHWVDLVRNKDGEPMFEHQVLKDVEPVDWGVYQEPIDFHLRMREIKELQYAKGEKRVVVVTKKVPGVVFRGLVLAQFKRERTKRRFLAFMEKKGVTVVKTAA